MDFQLVVLRGRSASQTLKLGDGITTIGRQDECQVRIKSSQVSRKHCQLYEQGGELMVKDLGSSNGTFVNGVRIEAPTSLRPGDSLTIGSVAFKVEGPGAATAAPAASVASGKKAGDTAIVEALLDDDAGAGGEDEFELDFDVEQEVPVQAPPETPAPAAEAKPAPKPAEAKPAEAKPAPASKPQPEPEPIGDEAVADFLLNIKIDDDD